MYKIIEGKIYNIAEAEEIYRYTTLAPEAIYKIEATTIICEIYQTKKGNFFIIEW